MKLSWLAPLLVLFVAQSVQAAEPPPIAAVESPAPQRRHWYGWQTALVDAASLGLGATVLGLSGNTGGSSDGNVAGPLIVSSYALGGPTVHAAHGQWAMAGASLGLRLGAPAAGALSGYLVGYAACPHDDQSDVPCSAVGAGFGLIAGAATALIVDSAVLAYEPESDEVQGVRLTPLIIAQPGRWGAGLGGTF